MKSQKAEFSKGISILRLILLIYLIYDILSEMPPWTQKKDSLTIETIGNR